MHHILKMTIALLKNEYKTVIENMKSSLEPYFQSPIEAIKLTSVNPVAFQKQLTVNHGLKATSAIFLLETTRSLLEKKRSLEKIIAFSHIQGLSDPLYKKNDMEIKISKAKYSFSSHLFELSFIVNPLYDNRYRFKLLRVFDIIV